jgi:large subunit ribosomal protein L10
MNRDQKAAVVEEVAAQIQESEAVFAVDYRGISVPQVAGLRERLNEAGARFRVVKNTLTEIAADRAGAEFLKDALEGPTAFTFVTADGGDVALAAKALAQFKREHNLLEFKGGLMNGQPLSAEQIDAIARLPAREMLHAQLVGVVASPITGLVRGLNALIAGLAIQLRQIADEGMVPRNGGTAAEEPAAEAPEEASQEAEQEAQVEQAEEEAARSAEGVESESSGEEASPADVGAAEDRSDEPEGSAGDDENDTPSAGDEKE